MAAHCLMALACLAAWAAPPEAGGQRLVRIAGQYFVPEHRGQATVPDGPPTRFRGKCRMRLFVAAGAQIRLRLAHHQVSARYTGQMRYTVEAPDGSRVLRGQLPPGESRDLAFTATAAGAYSLLLDPGSNASEVTVQGARLCIAAVQGETCRVIRGSRRLWFYVPEHGRGFEVRLRGQGTGETAAAVVFDAEGSQVARGSTASGEQAVIRVPAEAARAGGVWSLQVVPAETGAFEDASFSLAGQVGPFVAQRPDQLAVPMVRSRLAGVFRRGEASPMTLSGMLLAPKAAFRRAEIVVSVDCEEHEVYRRTLKADRHGAFRAELPREELPAGHCRLQLELRDAGAMVVMREHEFFVVARPRWLREDGVTLDRGRPLFARGLYHVRPDDYDLVKQQGFNIVQAHPDHVPRCRAAGLKAAVALYAGMAMRPDYYREKITAYKDHPAVVCWMIMDEPAAHNVPLEEIQRAYGLIRSLDPDRPAYMCLCRPDAYTTYGRATDVIAIDVYPIRQGEDDLSRIWRTLDIAFRDVPEQPVWFIGQVWSWPGREDPAERRLVTAAEHRCMTWLALTRGNVRGLMWYSFRDPDWYLPTSNPQVWAACKQVNRELIALEPVLLGTSHWTKAVRGSNDQVVQVGMRQHGQSRYLIAVNPNARDTTAAVPVGEGPDGGGAEVVFEDRRLPIQRGAVRDHFDPLEVHVYKIDGTSSP